MVLGCVILCSTHSKIKSVDHLLQSYRYHTPVAVVLLQSATSQKLKAEEQFIVLCHKSLPRKTIC